MNFWSENRSFTLPDIFSIENKECQTGALLIKFLFPAHILLYILCPGSGVSIKRLWGWQNARKILYVLLTAHAVFWFVKVVPTFRRAIFNVIFKQHIKPDYKSASLHNISCGKTL
jgi:hypothetical protein